MAEEKKTMLETHGMTGLLGLVDPEMLAIMNSIANEKPSGRLTGQLMVMKQNGEETGITGAEKRDIFSMFGVVALPKGVLKDMHKYPLVGMPRDQHIDIIFSTEEGEDRSDLEGVGVAGILTTGIWRV